MGETIPGGIYKGTDGSYHDANGKKVKAPEKALEAKAEIEGESAGESPAPAPAAPVTESQPNGEVIEAAPVVADAAAPVADSADKSRRRR